METYPEHPPVELSTTAHFNWGRVSSRDSQRPEARIVLAKITPETYGLVVACDNHGSLSKPLISVVIDSSFFFYADEMSSEVGIRIFAAYEAPALECVMQFGRPLDFAEFVRIVAQAKARTTCVLRKTQHQLEAVYLQQFVDAKEGSISPRVEMDT